MKRCIWCGRTLPDEEFYRDDRYADGLMTGCKACRCELSRRRYRETVPRQREVQHVTRQFGKSLHAMMERMTPRERWEAMCL